MIKTCEICGKPFEARRSDARFCSSTCRSRNRSAKRYVVPEPRLIDYTPEQAGYVERAAVKQAHDAASDLCRASKVAPAPRCIVYRELAEHIEDRLGGIGV